MPVFAVLLFVIEVWDLLSSYELVPQGDNLQFPDQAVGFITGANDGKLVVYDLDGNPLYFCETPPNVVISV